MSAEKTEDPTPSRLRQLRRRGDVPVGRELLRAAAAMGLPCGLWAGGQGFVERSAAAWQFGSWTRPGEIESLVQVMLSGTGWLLVVTVAAGAGVSAVVGVSQTGGLLAPGRLAPDGKRFLGFSALVQQWKAEALARAALTTGVALAVLALGLLTVGVAMDGLPGAMALASEGGATAVLGWAMGPLLLLGVGLVAILPMHAALDLVLARRTFIRRNRMSLKEIRDEMKREDGDPELRSKRDALRHELMDEQVQREVARADVVVRNPTHIAVALRYDPLEGGAPRILVSGKGAAARRIVRHAQRLGVPELEHRPVARALVSMPRGAEVPQTLHVAVAEILRWAAGLRSMRAQRD